jgi:adenosylcobinamide-GDP ribazoletransferase
VGTPRQSTLLLVAVQFLTRLPLPVFPHFEPGWLAQSLRYFPLVGAGVGLLNAGVLWLACRVFPIGVAVGLMLAVSLLVTGAFHEDGLADAFDGFGGGRTRERTLAIMHDSRIGAFGALALLILMGLKWTSLTSLPPLWLAFTLVVSHGFSRWCALGLIWALPYAREGGEGKAQPFASGLTAGGWVLGGLIAAPIPVALARFSLPASEWGAALSFACTGLAAGLALTLALGLYFRRRIGGYTGDCLGATQQLAELTILLVALAVVLPHPAG